MGIPQIVSAVAALGLMVATQAFSKEPFEQMDVSAVSAHLSDKTFHVYDANSDKVYADGHVPGAQHLAFDAVSADKLPKAKDETLVFYCKNTKCMASHEAAKKAVELGYQHVYVMPAGIDGWVKAGKATVKGNTPG